MSNGSNSRWLCKLNKHSSSKADLEALRLRPECEALRAWLANQMDLKLQPTPVDKPQAADHRLHRDAQIEVLRDIYLLLELKDV